MHTEQMATGRSRRSTSLKLSAHVVRPQTLSLVENSKLVGRPRRYHLMLVFQFFSLLPTPTSVVFERRISDIERIFKDTQLLYASRKSAWWVIVFASIDRFGQISREVFLAVESLVPFFLGGFQFGNVVALTRKSAKIGLR